MRHLAFLALTALTILIGATGDAFAGAVPISLPEPSTLAVLAAGLGAAAIVKFWRSK